MATFNNPADLVRHQKARQERLYRSMSATSEYAAALAKEEAERLTSGTTKSRELARLGHPYANGRGGASLLPINVQSGRLRRSWRIFRRRGPEGKGSVAFIMQNISPESKFVLRPGGTARMTDRKFWEELNKRVLPAARKKGLDFWRGALRG